MVNLTGRYHLLEELHGCGPRLHCALRGVEGHHVGLRPGVPLVKGGKWWKSWGKPGENHGKPEEIRGDHGKIKGKSWKIYGSMEALFTPLEFVVTTTVVSLSKLDATPSL